MTPILIEALPLYLLVFVFGLVIGSFLNVVIYRVPKNISIIKGRSYCPSCNHKINNRDLIPVLSYLLLKGKCRHCRARIALRYPLLEITTGLLALGIVLVQGIFLPALFTFALAAILLSIAVIDYDTMTIPDGLVLALIPVAILMAWSSGEWNLWSRIIGALVISLPMYISLYFIEDAFGGGDIKLFAALGFLLGWEKIFLTLFLASITAAVVGIGMARSNKETIKGKHIPFGPYICLGALIAALFGEMVLSWYFGLY